MKSLNEKPGLPGLTNGKWRIVALIGAGAVVAIALGVPLKTLVFLAVLALCPLMMMRMHGGSDHDHHDSAGK